jgi:hypothetical protein
MRGVIGRYNTELVASDAPVTRGRLRAAANSWLPEVLRPYALEQASKLSPPVPGGSVYTDDKAPVEWLVDRSIVTYAARGN